MRKQGYTYILLDLDGTITDSKEGLLESYRAGLAAVHFSDYTEEQLLSFLGPPLRQSLKYSFGFDETTLDAAMQEMCIRDRNIADAVTQFPLGNAADIPAGTA